MKFEQALTELRHGHLVEDKANGNVYGLYYPSPGARMTEPYFFATRDKKCQPVGLNAIDILSDFHVLEQEREVAQLDLNKPVATDSYGNVYHLGTRCENCSEKYAAQLKHKNEQPEVEAKDEFVKFAEGIFGHDAKAEVDAGAPKDS